MDGQVKHRGRVLTLPKEASMKNVIRGGLFLLLASCGLFPTPALAHGPGHHQEPAQKPEVPKEQTPEAEILKVLSLYRAAMEARSVDKLGEVVDPGLLILEGVHKNVGWADYRDNHIGPEMKEWKEFKAMDQKVLEVAVHGDLAYVVQEATFTIVMADKTTVLAGAETFVLKQGSAGWKIKHLHFSGKKKEPAAEVKP